jgi:hypothetical protein
MTADGWAEGKTMPEAVMIAGLVVALGLRELTDEMDNVAGGLRKVASAIEDTGNVAGAIGDLTETMGWLKGVSIGMLGIKDQMKEIVDELPLFFVP